MNSTPEPKKTKRTGAIFFLIFQVVLCVLIWRMSTNSKDTGIRVVAYFTTFLAIGGVVITALRLRRGSSASIVVLGLLLPATAHADPDLGAQMQLGRGFEACDEGDAFRYLEQRDYALKTDPSLKSWTGKLRNKWVVKDTLARCDRDMKAKSETDQRAATSEKLYSAVRSTCAINEIDEAAIEKYKQARAAYVAAAGNADPEHLVSKCDKDLPARLAEKKAKEKALAEKEAKWEADAARIRAANEKRDRELQAIIKAMKGDRAALFAKRGWPNGSEGPEERLAKAGRWDYTDDVSIGSSYVGNAVIDHTAVCTTRYEFSGDKIVRTSKLGRACR